MGFYTRHIFPMICDYSMSHIFDNTKRRDLLASVSGKILEIGFGTGISLAYYPSTVHAITTVDINPNMNPKAVARIEKSGIAVDHYTLDSQQLPFPDDTFDSIVSTATLCSIEALDRALKEMRRTLKPDGHFYFLEHGLAEDDKVQVWQKRLTPLQKRLSDGCHLDRQISDRIASAGFHIIQLDRYYMKGLPKMMGYMYQGVATKG